MEELEKLFVYIAVWGWQTLSTIFLVGAFIVYALPDNLISYSMGVALVLAFIMCEFMMLKRKRELV